MKFSGNDNQPQILFETNHYLVAYKPAGMAVPIEHHAAHSLEGFLLQFLKKKLQKQTVFLRPLHRLDKPVSGLVLFARSSKGLARLQTAQKKSKIEKFYCARVYGLLDNKCGKLVHYLEHGHHRACESENGKRCELLYRVISEKNNQSIVSIKLLTGRYHQIRAQLNAIGHPIVHDVRYHQNQPFNAPSIDLVHTHIRFPDPITQKIIEFKWRSFPF